MEKSIFKSRIYSRKYSVGDYKSLLLAIYPRYFLDSRTVNTGKFETVLETELDHNALLIGDKFDLGNNDIVEIIDKWVDSSSNVIYVIKRNSYVDDEESKIEAEREIEVKNKELDEKRIAQEQEWMKNIEQQEEAIKTTKTVWTSIKELTKSIFQ